MMSLKNETIKSLTVQNEKQQYKSNGDKYQSQLESQIRDLIKEQEKMALINEIALLAVEDYQSVMAKMEDLITN